MYWRPLSALCYRWLVWIWATNLAVTPSPTPEHKSSSAPCPFDLHCDQNTKAQVPKIRPQVYPYVRTSDCTWLWDYQKSACQVCCETCCRDGGRAYCAFPTGSALKSAVAFSKGTSAKPEKVVVNTPVCLCCVLQPALFRMKCLDRQSWKIDSGPDTSEGICKYLHTCKMYVQKISSVCKPGLSLCGDWIPRNL